jgi:AcrR family transcriptional regulator
LASRPKSNRPARLKPGVKREQIVETAVAHFGRRGYEDTKWADVAAAVDIGSTALYHYFESKQHCLFEIMAKALTDFRDRFDRISAAHDDWTEALLALLRDQFDLTEHEVLRNRVLVAEVGRLAIKRDLPREEAARVAAREHTRELEFAWGTFLARGMQQGVIPENDPRLLTRAFLGLHNSVWHWYHPGGSLGLAEVGKFFIRCELDVLGCPADLQDEFAAAA